MGESSKLDIELLDSVPRSLAALSSVGHSVLKSVRLALRVLIGTGHRHKGGPSRCLLPGTRVKMRCSVLRAAPQLDKWPGPVTLTCQL